jgi:hypothetical protein
MTDRDHERYLEATHSARMLGALIVGLTSGVAFGVWIGYGASSWIVGLVVGGLAALAGVVATGLVTGRQD